MEHRQLTWRQRGELWLRLGIRFVLAGAAVWLAAGLGRRLLYLFAPFLFALAAAALLNPGVRRLQRMLGWSRSALTLIVLLLLLGAAGGVLGLLGYAAVGQLVSLVQNWSGLLDSLQAGLERLEALFAHLLALVPPQVTEMAQSLAESLLAWLNEVVPSALASAGSAAGEKAMGLPSFLVALVIFTMATYLLTADYPYLRSRAVQRLDEGVLHFLGQLRATALMVIWGVVALFRRVMEPKVVGDQTGLSPILSLVGIYVGMKLAGVLGMILGPIVLLVLLNLAGMGMFDGLRRDVIAAVWDVAAILRGRPE